MGNAPMQTVIYGMAKKVVTRFKDKHRTKVYFREWRKFRGLTLEQASERAGMSHGNISAMERGAQDYTRSGLEALAHAYQCDPADLLMRNPNDPDAIWTLWERAKPGERKMIVNIANQVVGKTGTSG